MNAERQLSRRQFVKTSAAALAVTAAPLALPGLVHAQTESPTKKLRIGIAGGRFGSLFFWHEHPGCVVAAVSDLVPSRCQHLKQVYRCDKSYPSLEEMVKDPNLDAIGVFTDGTKHFDHVMLALAHGKHVVSAVPAVLAHSVAEGLDQAHKMFEKIQQTGLTYMMAETSYFQQNTISVRKLYNAGELGQITCCESDYFHPGAKLLCGTKDKPTWRYGLPPMFYGMHNTIHLIGITGERLKEVSCDGWGNSDEILKQNPFGNNPFWNETAHFRSDKGTPLRMRVWWEAPVWDGVKASWFGTKMSVALNPDGDKCDKWMPAQKIGTDDAGFTVAKASKSPLNDPPWWQTDMLPVELRHKSGHEGSHTFITHEFVDSVNKGRLPSINIHEALAYTVPGIIAHQSALKGGELLKIPTIA